MACKLLIHVTSYIYNIRLKFLISIVSNADDEINWEVSSENDSCVLLLLWLIDVYSEKEVLYLYIRD